MVRFERQAGLVSEAALQFSIRLIGAGGIGSPTALILAQMGCRSITICDPDVVEEANLAYQVFPVQAIGRPKVEALSEVLALFCGCVPVTEQRRITGEDQLQGVVICAVDTLDDRRNIWQGVVRNPAVPVYIDARMGGEMAAIFVVRPCDPDDVGFYEDVLRQEAVELPCTARGIAYNTWGIASLIGNLIKRYAMDEPLPREVRLDYRTLTLAVWERTKDETG